MRGDLKEPGPALQLAFALACLRFDSGAVLEFGVRNGRSLRWMHASCQRFRFYGFDSWSGLPDETSGVSYPWRHKRGRMRAKYARVRRMLPESVNLVKGLFEDTLTPELQDAIGRQPLAFANLDADLHRSTVEALAFIEPLIAVGTVLYIDDLTGDNRMGADRALAEWPHRFRLKQLIPRVFEVVT